MEVLHSDRRSLRLEGGNIINFYSSWTRKTLSFIHYIALSASSFARAARKIGSKIGRARDNWFWIELYTIKLWMLYTRFLCLSFAYTMCVLEPISLVGKKLCLFIFFILLLRHSNPIILLTPMTEVDERAERRSAEFSQWMCSLFSSLFFILHNWNIHEHKAKRAETRREEDERERENCFNAKVP